MLHNFLLEKCHKSRMENKILILLNKVGRDAFEYLHGLMNCRPDSPEMIPSSHYISAYSLYELFLFTAVFCEEFIFDHRNLNLLKLIHILIVVYSKPKCPYL